MTTLTPHADPGRSSPSKSRKTLGAIGSRVGQVVGILLGIAVSRMICAPLIRQARSEPEAKTVAERLINRNMKSLLKRPEIRAAMQGKTNEEAFAYGLELGKDAGPRLTGLEAEQFTRAFVPLLKVVPESDCAAMTSGTLPKSRLKALVSEGLAQLDSAQVEAYVRSSLLGMTVVLEGRPPRAPSISVDSATSLALGTLSAPDLERMAAAAQNGADTCWATRRLLDALLALPPGVRGEALLALYSRNGRAAE